MNEAASDIKSPVQERTNIVNCASGAILTDQ